MAANYLHLIRHLNRDVFRVLTVYAFLGFTYSGIYIVLFNLYLLRLGYGVEFVGTVNAAGLLAFALLSLPAGALGSRFGVRRMLIGGQILMALGLTMPPLTEFVPASLQPAWIIATFVLAYIGGTAFMVNVNPFLMAASGEEERDYVFSMSSAMMPLTGFIGGITAGFLPGLCSSLLGVAADDPAAFRYPLILAGLLNFAALPGLFTIREVRNNKKEQQTQAASSPAPYGLIGFMALIVLCIGVTNGAVGTFFNVYLDSALHTPVSLVGLLTALPLLAGVPAALAMPLLAKRFGHARTYAFGIFGVVLALLPLALLPHWAAAGLSRVAMMLALGMANAAFNLLTQQLVVPRWRSLMSGAVMSARGLSMTLVSFGGGYLVAMIGYSGLFLGSAAITALGCSLFWFRFCAAESEQAPVLLPQAA